MQTYQEFRIEDYMERSAKSNIGNYKFLQIFGYKGPNEPVNEQDIITSVKFDKEGRFIAISDKAGRVIIFQNSESTDKTQSKFDYFTQFQSHMRQFDPLKSVYVDEEIVDITWLNRQGKYLKIATTNSRNIKVWKVYQKFGKKIVKSAGKELNIPKLENIQTDYVAELQKQFPTKHSNPILQVSESSHQQYLLSTDETQSFLWNMERPDCPYIVCEEGSNNAEDRELITCCKMHPNNDNIFLYGMSKGSLKMGDMRLSAVNQADTLCFKASNGIQKNYLLNLISNISSATFTSNGKYIVSRDYMTVKVWDVSNTKRPVNSIMLNDGLKSKLSEMVENESIYDQFKVAANADGSNILTGSYNNTFNLIDLDANNAQYELNYKKATVCKLMNKPAPITKMDYDRKVLAGDFHSTKNILAVASLNCFFTYSL